MPVARALATTFALLAGCAGLAAPAAAGHVYVGFGIGVPGIAVIAPPVYVGLPAYDPPYSAPYLAPYLAPAYLPGYGITYSAAPFVAYGRYGLRHYRYPPPAYGGAVLHGVRRH